MNSEISSKKTNSDNDDIFDLSNHWFIQETDKLELLNLKIEIICDDCKLKSYEEMVKCTHIDNVKGSRLNKK